MHRNARYASRWNLWNPNHMESSMPRHLLLQESKYSCHCPGQSHELLQITRPYVYLVEKQSQEMLVGSCWLTDVHKTSWGTRSWGSPVTSVWKVWTFQAFKVKQWSWDLKSCGIIALLAAIICSMGCTIWSKGPFIDLSVVSLIMGILPWANRMPGCLCTPFPHIISGSQDQTPGHTEVPPVPATKFHQDLFKHETFDVDSWWATPSTSETPFQTMQAWSELVRLFPKWVSPPKFNL